MREPILVVWRSVWTVSKNGGLNESRNRPVTGFVARFQTGSYTVFAVHETGRRARDSLETGSFLRP